MRDLTWVKKNFLTLGIGCRKICTGIVLKKHYLLLIDAPSDPVKFELTLSWHVFIASTTCTFNSNFSVECILNFKCGLFECFRSLSIYMNVEQWSFIQILSHKVALYVDHMYINIHKKNSPVAWYCWRRPVRGTVI